MVLFLIMAHMRKPKIFIIVAAFIAFALVVCLTVAVVFSFLARHPSLAAFDDSDLIPARMEIPVASNAFWTLLKATNELYWPASLERKLSDLSDNTNWDDALAADMLAKNHGCLDLFGAAMQQPWLLVPEPKTFDEGYPYLGGWNTISRVESIRFFTFLRAGNEKEAFDTAFKIIQFGHRIENSGGPIIHYLVGSGIKVRGLRQLLLALKIYKEQHGKLPESLSELAPEFFPQVPVDDFDGKPFRYLPDKKLIYSVGPDLKDSGGEDSNKNSGIYDLLFKIDF